MTSDALRKIFSENIKTFRKLNNLTQMALAEKADLSVGYLCDLEAGKKWAMPETITKLSAALNIQPFQLFLSDADFEKSSLTTDLLNFSSELKQSIDIEIANLMEKYR